jgi:hypothetical protein
MLKEIQVGNRILKVGDKLKAINSPAAKCPCPPQSIVWVACIRKEGSAIEIGLRSEKAIDHWHNLNGMTEGYHGWWANRDVITECFVPVTSQHVVTKEVEFKGKNLKGKKCKLLGSNRRLNYCFVEFEENVGGSGADGLGKSGHCVQLPVDALKEAKGRSEETGAWR